MPTRSSHPGAEVPRFSLYGETVSLPSAEFVHVELIETRSRLHDWHIARHTHPGLYQVLFLCSGSVRATVDDVLWERDGPVALTVHPSVVHGFDFSEQALGFVLTVDQNVLFSAPGRSGDLFAPLFVEPLAIPIPEVPLARIVGLLDNLVVETSWPEQDHTLMQEWLARSVLLLLARTHAEQSAASASGNGDFEVFSRFRAAVEQHYKSGAPVAYFAGLVRVTPTRLNRLCLKIVGKSAFDLIQDRLMLEACRKLTYAPSGVASVAYELGFQDPAYFSRVFRKRMGVTPKQFRQRGAASAG